MRTNGRHSSHSRYSRATARETAASNRPRGAESVDAALGLGATEQAFDVPAKQSRSYAWRIAVPDGLGFLTYKAVGATAQASGLPPTIAR